MVNVKCKRYTRHGLGDLKSVAKKGIQTVSVWAGVKCNGVYRADCNVRIIVVTTEKGMRTVSV